MCTIDSANAPEFFMHHGFIDKIWHDYQKKSIANKNAFFPSIKSRLRTTPYYPRDFIDFAKQPKCVKACYDEPTVHTGKKVMKFLRGEFSTLYLLSFLLQAHFAIYSKVHFAICSKIHFVIYLKLRFVISCEVHFVVNCKVHFVVNCKVHFTVNCKVHFVVYCKVHCVI